MYTDWLVLVCLDWFFLVHPDWLFTYFSKEKHRSHLKIFWYLLHIQAVKTDKPAQMHRLVSAFAAHTAKLGTSMKAQAKIYNYSH